MLEFDIESLIRKWRACLGIALVSPTKKQQVIYSNFDTAELGQFLVYIDGSHSPMTLTADITKTKPSDYDPLQILYHSFESGWYPTKGPGSTCIFLIKNHIKHFNVGINSISHRWSTYNMVTGKEVCKEICEANFLGTVEVGPYDSDKKIGILSKKVWYFEDDLFYLRRKIGVFKNNILKVDQETLIPYIKPLVGEKCQIVCW